MYRRNMFFDKAVARSIARSLMGACLLSVAPVRGFCMDATVETRSEIITRPGIIDAMNEHVREIGLDTVMNPHAFVTKLSERMLAPDATPTQVVAARVLDGLLTVDFSQHVNVDVTAPGWQGRYRQWREENWHRRDLPLVGMDIGVNFRDNPGAASQELQRAVDHYRNTPEAANQVAGLASDLRRVYNQIVSDRLRINYVLGGLFDDKAKSVEVPISVAGGTTLDKLRTSVSEALAAKRAAAIEKARALLLEARAALLRDIYRSIPSMASPNDNLSHDQLAILSGHFIDRLEPLRGLVADATLDALVARLAELRVLEHLMAAGITMDAPSGLRDWVPAQTPVDAALQIGLIKTAPAATLAAVYTPNLMAAVEVVNARRPVRESESGRFVFLPSTADSVRVIITGNLQQSLHHLDGVATDAVLTGRRTLTVYYDAERTPASVNVVGIEREHQITIARIPIPW